MNGRRARASVGPGAKSDVRYLGIDDGPFLRTDETTRLVGVVTRGPSYVEGVLSDTVTVDGADATTAAIGFLQSRFRPLVRAVFLNGIFAGGFNVLDPERLHEELGRPVLALVRTAPRPALVRRAIAKAFPERHEDVWRRVAELEPVALPGTKLWATVRGASLREAARLVRAATVRGDLPEPLRLAHVIASGVGRGESRGRA